MNDLIEATIEGLLIGVGDLILFQSRALPSVHHLNLGTVETIGKHGRYHAGRKITEDVYSVHCKPAVKIYSSSSQEVQVKPLSNTAACWQATRMKNVRVGMDQIVGYLLTQDPYKQYVPLIQSNSIFNVPI